MSCFFCNSYFHVSEFCDIHVSDQARKDIARSKNSCENCLNFVQDKQICLFCKPLKKYSCFICFSKFHHTVFCPERFIVAKLFIPNIDQILLHRFVQVLSEKEKYTLLFSSPAIFKCIQPLRVFHVNKNFRLCSGDLDIFFHWARYSPRKKITVITNNVNIYEHNFITSKGFPSSNLDQFIFQPKSVTFKNSNISANDFYSILSYRTKELFCENLKFTAQVLFSGILKRSPDIKDISIKETKIILDFFPFDFDKCRNVLDPINIDVAFNDFNDIDVEDYVSILKTKLPKPKIVISLNVDAGFSDDDISHQNAKKALQNDLLQHFTPISTIEEDMSIVRIVLWKSVQDFDIFGTYSAKS